MRQYIACIILLVALTGCSTIATESEDGKTLTIKGAGSAEFESGAKIQGGTWIPALPKIEVDK